MYSNKPVLTYLIYHYKSTCSYCSSTLKWMNVDTSTSTTVTMKSGQVVDMYVYCNKNTAVVYSRVEFLDSDTGYHYYCTLEGNIVDNPEDFYNQVKTKTIRNPVNVVGNTTEDYWETDNAENESDYE